MRGSIFRLQKILNDIAKHKIGLLKKRVLMVAFPSALCQITGRPEIVNCFLFHRPLPFFRMSSIATIGTIDGTVRATALVPVTEPEWPFAVFLANESKGV